MINRTEQELQVPELVNLVSGLRSLTCRFDQLVIQGAHHDAQSHLSLITGIKRKIAVFRARFRLMISTGHNHLHHGRIEELLSATSPLLGNFNTSLRALQMTNAV